MENIIKNKLLIVFVLLIILTSTMCSSVFADNETYSFFYNKDGVIYDFSNLPMNPNVFSYFFLDDESPALYLSQSPITIVKPYGSDRYYICSDTTIYILNHLQREETSTGFVYSSTGGLSIVEPPSKSFCSQFGFVFSNFDLCNTSGEVVFQGAPQEQEGITNPPQGEGTTNPTNPVEEITSPAVQVELMKPTQVEGILPQIIAVVEIVLPIFLGIFGVLLVLYLIKYKNLLNL